VSIIFKERTDEIRKGIVEYQTKEWIEARQAKNAEAIKKGIGDYGLSQLVPRGGNVMKGFSNLFAGLATELKERRNF